jgi:nitrogen fixation/metabolism regulation signal transduction histidine kinase
MNYSSVSYNNKSHKVTDDLGYLAYILPDIFTLLCPYIHRIIIFVSSENSTILFPGQRLPYGYDTEQSFWFKSLLNNLQEPFVFNPSYNDSLNNQKVVSISQTIDMNSSIIGLNVEIQEHVLYSLFSTNAYILESEEKVLTTSDGRILYNKNSSFINQTIYKTMKDFNSDIWKDANNSKVNESLFILHENHVFYRVTIQKIPAGSKEPWLYLFLFLKEKTLMKYKNETQDTLNSFSYLLLGLTCIIGVIIIIVSAIIVNLTGSSVSKPLIGIKTLTDRINVGEVKIEEELEKLEEGTEQVAELVRAFKSLATTISSRRHTDVNIKGKEIFPPNELFQTGRVTWKAFLSQIPNN